MGVAYQSRYAEQFPIEPLSDAARIIRAGTLSSERAAFVGDVWEVEGYGLYQAFGHPGEPKMMGSSADVFGHAPEITDEEDCCKKIDEVLAQQSSPGAKAVDPATILMIVKFLWDLFKKKK